MSRPDRTTLLLRFGYDGSGFRGVVPQPDLPTVGGALRSRLEIALGQRARNLVLTSRTDAGVHAVENLATCWVPGSIDDAVLAAIAQTRADGLHRVQARRVPFDCFARTIGSGKLYRYRLEGGWDADQLARIRTHDLDRRHHPDRVAPAPPHEGRVWQVALPLDPEPMRQAARHLVGTHDFSSFKVGPLGDRSPVRTVTGIEIHESYRAGRPHLVVEVRGTGFLRKMVRIIVGTLAEVGAGLRQPSELKTMLAARSRQATGQAALARGLTLVHIDGAEAWFPEPWQEAPL